MSYGAGPHGAWCGARTVPMQCRYCGQQVFYFYCNCGSKVFFNALGDPWPRHLCHEYLEATGRARPEPPPTQPKVVQPPEEVLYAWAIMSPKEHDNPVHVEPAYAVKMRRHLEAERAGKRERLRMEPPPKRGHQDVGRVTDLAERVDVYKQAHLPPDNPMAAALLGRLAKEPMARVVLVVDDPDQDDLEEYTCYVPQKLLKKAGVIRGDVVHFRLTPVEIPGRTRVWLCTDLEPPFKW